MTKILTEKKLNQNKGITLIALIITIIVLLILAGVSIAMLAGENGILNRATEASTETTHKQLYEILNLQVSEYLIERNAGEEKAENTIEYLKEKGYISDIHEGEENVEKEEYQINVEKLMGTKGRYGNGNATEEKKDVYILEEVIKDTGKIEKMGEVATTTPVKIAASTNTVEKEYKIIYYGRTESENRELGKMSANVPKYKIGEEIIFTFKLGFEEQHTVKYGTTWRQFFASYDYYIFDDSIVVDNRYGYDLGLSNYNLTIDDIIEPGIYEFSKIDVECVYPNSKILVSKEGATIEAKDLKEGNDIAYYNFETKEVELGKVEKAYIHKDATKFVKYEFEDGSYLEATDYHPIYTKEGWKSLTRRNGYEIPIVGDEVKTEEGWKKITKIDSFEGLEDCYDFVIKSKDGMAVDNYFANGTLVQGSY